MSKATVLFVADTHLDHGPDSEYALWQVGKLAKSLRVCAVVGCGDLIDKQRNRAKPVAAWLSLLDTLEVAGVRSFFIQGQHDQDDPPWLAVHRHAQHLHDRVVEIAGYTLRGLDFQPHGALQEALARVDAPVDVLVAHQVWGDWMGSIALPQGEFADLRNVGTLVSGDLHKHVIESAEDGDGKTIVVCSPGATWQQRINEPDKHCVVVLRDDGVLKAHPLKSRVFLDWPVLIRPEDVDAFVAEIEPALAEAAQQAAARELPEALQRPRLRCTFAHHLGDAARRIENAVAGRAWLTLKELPPAEKAGPAAAGRRTADDAPATPLSELDAVVDPGSDPEVHTLLARCLQAPDPVQAFAAWRAEFLGESAPDRRTDPEAEEG